MAQTKRKRRTKHRGNAAGTIEARGRTGRKPTADEQRKASSGAREERRFVEPTWTSAADPRRPRLGDAVRALPGRAGGRPADRSRRRSGSSVAAFLIYVPLGYQVDHIFWERRMRKAGRPIPPEKPR